MQPPALLCRSGPPQRRGPSQPQLEVWMLGFLWMQSKGSLGLREPPPPSAGAGAAAARRREPSFLPAEELSAHFQTSLILSNLWVSMKSFQFDTRSMLSSSQSCAIPSSLFWNLVCVFFWYKRKPNVSIPQRKLWPAHGRYSAVFTCISFAVSEILTVQFRSDSFLLTAVEMH